MHDSCVAVTVHDGCNVCNEREVGEGARRLHDSGGATEPTLKHTLQPTTSNFEPSDQHLVSGCERKLNLVCGIEWHPAYRNGLDSLGQCRHVV